MKKIKSEVVCEREKNKQLKRMLTWEQNESEQLNRFVQHLKSKLIRINDKFNRENTEKEQLQIQMKMFVLLHHDEIKTLKSTALVEQQNASKLKLAMLIILSVIFKCVVLK